MYLITSFKQALLPSLRFQITGTGYLALALYCCNYINASDTALSKIKSMSFEGEAAFKHYRFIDKTKTDGGDGMKICSPTKAGMKYASQAERFAISRLDDQMRGITKEIREGGLSRDILTRVSELVFHAFDWELQRGRIIRREDIGNLLKRLLWCWDRFRSLAKALTRSSLHAWRKLPVGKRKGEKCL